MLIDKERNDFVPGCQSTIRFHSVKLNYFSAMSKFVRPESLPFPETYYTFKARDLSSDDIVEYRVQDLPDNFHEQAIDLIVKHFLPQETFCACKRIVERPASVKVIRDFYSEILKNKLTLACFRNGNDDDLVGINVFIVKTKGTKSDDKADVKFN